MSLKNYAEKLFHEGHLNLNDDRVEDQLEIQMWSPDIAESILWVEANKDQFVSILAFFWTTVFFTRETLHPFQADEVIANTVLNRIDSTEAESLIRQYCPDWWDQNCQLWPQAKWYHMIWQEPEDLFLLMESEHRYYAFNWELNGQFDETHRFEH